MITFDKDPSALVKLVVSKVKPTPALAILVAEDQRSRMLDRTGKGKDFEEKPFVEYSQNGPVYYYPAGRANGRTIQSKKAASGRLFKKITGKAARSHTGKKRALTGSAGEAWVTPGGGLGFSSYAALKKWAGRNNVDLRGLKAPHMLQSMQVKANSRGTGEVESIIGIYGAPAARAEGHSKGAKHLPQRKFLAASKKDEKAMAKIVDRFVEKAVKAS
jgi:phage gpG-like protein